MFENNSLYLKALMTLIPEWPISTQQLLTTVFFDMWNIVFHQCHEDENEDER